MLGYKFFFKKTAYSYCVRKNNYLCLGRGKCLPVVMKI